MEASKSDPLEPIHLIPSFLKNYLDVGSFFGLVPWKFIVPLKISYTHRISRAITAGMHAIIIFHATMCSISPLTKPTPADGVGYQKVVSIVLTAWSLHLAAFVHTVWFKKELLERILHKVHAMETAIEKLPTVGKPPNKNQMTLVSYIFIVIMLSITCLDTVFAYLEVQKQGSFYQSITNTMKANYFVIKDVEQQGWAVDLWTAFHFVASILSLLLSHYGYSFALCYALLLYWLTKGVTLKIKGINFAKNLDAIMNLVSEMMEISDLYEESLGLLFSSYSLVLLPLHSYKLKGAIGEGDYWKYPPIILYLAGWLSFMFISAETNHLMKIAVPILRMTSEYAHLSVDSQRQISKAIILSTEIYGNSFGIRGNGFTISYGLIGNMAGIVITCVVIMSQIWT